MASPQVERGHLDLANELVEQFAKLHLSGNEWRVLFHVLRQTYGWHKKSDAISLSQFEEHTGLSHASAHESVRKLLSRNVLEVVGKKGLIPEYQLQKNYDQWQPHQSKRETGREKGTGRYLPTPVVGKKGLKPVGIYRHTKETKETITKDIFANGVKNPVLQHPRLAQWIAIVGTTLRTNLTAQVKAAEYLAETVGEARFEELLMAVRYIRQDRYGHRGLQIKLTNYTGLQRNLEEVEAYIQATVDTKHVSTHLSSEEKQFLGIT